jgi:protein-S-isoprenylcysteine O-methyltransferase Ste14
MIMAIDLKFWINVLWLLIGAVWLATSARLKPIQTMQHPGSRLVQTLLLICAGMLVFSGLPSSGLLRLRVVPQIPSVATIGIALTVTGAAIAIAARFHLGGNWSGSATIKHGHVLVRSGPYSLVRHPIYFGLLIAALGTAVAYGEVRDLIAIPVIVVAFRIKQVNEERLLIQAFGDEYRAYRRAVRWAMLPFVL